MIEKDASIHMERIITPVIVSLLVPISCSVNRNILVEGIRSFHLTSRLEASFEVVAFEDVVKSYNFYHTLDMLGNSSKSSRQDQL